MKHMKPLAMALALLMIGMTAFAAPVAQAKLGEEAPDFELKTLNGETFKLSDYRGKVVYLNEWTTWCPSCVLEMPDIQKLSEDHPDDLVVLGVSLDETEELARAFVEENGYTYTFAWDGQYLVGGLLYPSRYIPYSVFIAPDGTISSIDVGLLTYAAMIDRYDRAAAVEDQ